MTSTAQEKEIKVFTSVTELVSALSADGDVNTAAASEAASQAPWARLKLFDDAELVACFETRLLELMTNGTVETVSGAVEMLQWLTAYNER